MAFSHMTIRAHEALSSRLCKAASAAYSCSLGRFDQQSIELAFGMVHCDVTPHE